MCKYHLRLLCDSLEGLAGLLPRELPREPAVNMTEGEEIVTEGEKREEGVEMRKTKVRGDQELRIRVQVETR